MYIYIFLYVPKPDGDDKLVVGVSNVNPTRISFVFLLFFFFFNFRFENYLLVVHNMTNIGLDIWLSISHHTRMKTYTTASVCFDDDVSTP